MPESPKLPKLTIEIDYSEFFSIGDSITAMKVDYSIPRSFHFLSTAALVLSSMRISSGQGRVKPSVGHLRVASIPILEPKLGRREAWSSESTGPA